MDFSFDDTEKLTTEMTIKQLLRSTNREGIECLIDWLDKSDFFVAPASTKYHLDTIGGLAFHSLSVYKRLKEKLTNDNIYGSYNEDTLIISAILHDVCKMECYDIVKKWRKNENNEWEEYSSYEFNDKLPLGHGEKSVILIEKFIKLTEEEMLAIRWHMGAFEDSNINRTNYSNAISICPLVLALHEADTESSKIIEEKYIKDNS